MKPNIKNHRNKECGFTIAELLVTLAIMGVMTGVLVSGLAAGRVPRNIKIAENELVTNIRKVQSFTLSGRDMEVGQPIQYYVLKFDLAKPTEYAIQAIYDATANGTPKVMDIEVIHLPKGIRLSQVSPITITRPAPLSSQAPDRCALVVFQAPFAKIMTQAVSAADGNCELLSPPLVSSGDNHNKILTFVANTSSSITSTDSVMNIRLGDEFSSVPAKTITINGITGLISFD